MPHRHCSVTIDWDDEVEFDGLTGAEIRDLLTNRFEAMAAYYSADLFITVAGE